MVVPVPVQTVAAVAVAVPPTDVALTVVAVDNVALGAAQPEV